MPSMTKQLRDMAAEVKNRKFARAYVKNGGNATQAMLEVGPYTMNSAKDVGSKLIKREAVRQEIRRFLKELEIDYRYVMSSRKEFIDTALRQLRGEKTETEPFVSPSDADKHLRGLETIMERLEEKGITENKSSHLHLHVENKSVGQLVNARKENMEWFNNIIDDAHLPQDTSSNDTPDEVVED